MRLRLDAGVGGYCAELLMSGGIVRDMKKNIKVLVVDDHCLVRGAFLSFIDAHEGMTVIGAVESAEEALKVMQMTAADVVVVDIKLGDGMNGITATEKIRELSPDTQVIVVSEYCTTEFMSHSLAAGALGYFCKECEPSELLAGIRKVAEGNLFLSGKAAAVMAQDSDPARPRLTSKEQDVFCHIKQGRTAKVSAAELGVSVRTVNVHRASILKKLGADNVLELLAGMLGAEHTMFLAE